MLSEGTWQNIKTASVPGYRTQLIRTEVDDMNNSKRWLALLLSALLITGSVTGPVFASETDIADQTSDSVEIENPEGFAPEEDASVDEYVQEGSFGDVILEEDDAFGEGGESVQEEAVLSEEPAEAESFEEAPVLSEEPQETDTAEEAPSYAGDPTQDEELADSAQDEDFEDSVLPEEPADSVLPDQIVEEPETQEEEVSEEPQQVEIQFDFDEERHTLAPDENLPSQDELFAGFVNTEFGISSGNRKLRKISMGSKLTGIEKIIYDNISGKLPQIAEGTISSTVFEIPLEEIGIKTAWTAEELGVAAIFADGKISQDAKDAAYAKFMSDDDAVVSALLADNPYLLYWFDKTEGWQVGFPSLSARSDGYTEELLFVGSITYSFHVSQEYAGVEAYTVDTSIGDSVVMAAQNASEILDEFSGQSDYDKLRGYMETICSWVSYNSAAADDPSTPYGNPWQMIWVFDGDPSTNVVCEGYSKAFQYLCDRSTFDDDISCYSVSGTMGGGTGAGPHMWNIVTMDDGRNYLVDVTNCDYGTAGEGGRLFLVGTDGSVDQGYVFVLDNNSCVSYTYKQETINLYTDSILSLANEFYTERPRIDDADVQLVVTDYVYDGTPQEPDVFVIYNGAQLIRDTDYEVKYFNNTNAGQATVVVHGIGDYAGSAETTFTIHKADQTITASDLSLTYPESGTIEVSGNEGKLSYSSSNSKVVEVDGSGKVTAIGADTATITITAAATDNYNETTKDITVTVAKGVQTITASDLSLTYPESGKITVSGNEGELTYTSDNQDVAEVDESGNVTAKGVGTTTITITAAGTANYNEESKQVTVKVQKGTQTIKASDLTLTYPESGTIEVSGNIGELSFICPSTGVAEVNASGEVTAKGPGKVVITIKAAATDNYEEAAKDITVTVVKPLQTITASDLSLTYPESGTIEISGNEGDLSFSSSDTNIAEVDGSGKVTAKRAGTATITITAAETAEYRETSKEITVTVAKANQTITASNLSLTYPNKGKITVSGNKGTLSYTSSKTSVATVDASGNVTAKGAGSATITIKAAATSGYNAASRQITVTVAKAAQSITTKAKASSVAVGKTVAVTTTGAKGTVTYKTSNTGIATVNASTGLVTAKKVGTVKITATAAATSNYNAASRTVTIKVVPAATTSLKALNLAKGIKVTWAKVTGANGYYIYRNSSKVKTITSGTTVTWTDTAANTNGTKYVYKVVAKASIGASTLSKSLTTYKVTAPTNKSAVNAATRKAVLTWTRNASANGYQVQYSLASNFSGAKTVTITKNTTLTTTVSSLTKGKTYYTRIRAYKTVGSTRYYSNWSASRSVKISK